MKVNVARQVAQGRLLEFNNDIGEHFLEIITKASMCILIEIKNVFCHLQFKI